MAAGATADAGTTNPGPGSSTVYEGDSFVDVETFERELEERNRERFFTFPDGSGSRQTVTRGVLAEAVPSPVPVSEPLPETGIRPCGARVRLPVIREKGSQRQYDLEYPALERRDRRAGYVLPVPAGATGVSLDAWVRAGQYNEVVLGVLDAEGFVVAVVNNSPTESIPETPFRYASVKWVLSLPRPVVAAGAVLVLDREVAARSLPAACRVPAGEGGKNFSGGRVTLRFLGNAEK